MGKVVFDHFYIAPFSTLKQTHCALVECDSKWWWCRASCPWMSVDILGTNCDQCWSMVQCCVTETVKLIRTQSPGRPPRLSHSSWTLSDSKWVTHFLKRILNIHPSGILTVPFGCYMASPTGNCCCLGAFWVHHTTMHHAQLSCKK